MSLQAEAGSAGVLGQAATYTDQYDAGLLYPMPRAPQRAALGIRGQPPFLGADLWTAYELSWLGPRGKPQVAIAHFVIPCESTHLIESKSFKLYLNSFSGTVFSSAAEVRARLVDDVSAAIWHGGPMRASATVQLVLPADFSSESFQHLQGVDLDRLDIECSEDLQQGPAPELLRAALTEKPVQETLYSRLLKSNCPVTGQPDWGSVQVSYTGPQIDQGGLLQYIVSFRRSSGFHEHCVERIYTDIMQRCQPSELTVYARYTRRGGLDINPYRTSHPGPLPARQRTQRQ